MCTEARIYSKSTDILRTTRQIRMKLLGHLEKWILTILGPVLTGQHNPLFTKMDRTQDTLFFSIETHHKSLNEQLLSEGNVMQERWSWHDSYDEGAKDRNQHPQVRDDESPPNIRFHRFDARTRGVVEHDKCIFLPLPSSVIIYLHR